MAPLVSLSAVTAAGVAATIPRQLTFMNAGERNLQTVYTTLCAHGLAAVDAVDDISKLFSVFDAAVDKGMGCYVNDYVVEVCADKYLTSNDPNEAYLLDAECVHQWARHRALPSLQASVCNSIRKHPLTPYASSIAKDKAKADSLVMVLESLTGSLGSRCVCMRDRAYHLQRTSHPQDRPAS